MLGAKARDLTDFEHIQIWRDRLPNEGKGELSVPGNQQLRGEVGIIYER